MNRFVGCVAAALVAVLVMLVLPAAGQAKVTTYTLRYGPVSMGGFNVALPKAPVKAPGVDGYVIGHDRLAGRRARPAPSRSAT